MTAETWKSPVPLLMIVCGLPFSGKTSMASGLASDLNDTVHVDIDSINTERGLGLHGEAVPMTEWSATYQLAYERASAALANGQSVVFDAANYSRAQRDILRMHARRAGADSIVLYVDVSEEECRRRLHAQSASDVDLTDFERIVSRFDPPVADEQVILYLQGMQVEDLVSGLRQMLGP